MTSKTLTLYQRQDTKTMNSEYHFKFELEDFAHDVARQQASYEYWLEHPEFNIITLDAEEGVND